MTRKHFQAIATIIDVARDEYDNETAERIAGDLAAYFQGVNPRFDVARFLEACGFPGKILS
jgi:hypothetical protein